MGALGKLINISLFFFFALMAINVPLLNGQILFPGIYPKLLTDLKDWYSSEFNDYLFIEKPLFFVGLVWHEIIFLLPLSIVNIYAILTSKSWFGTTSLLYGASFLTSMAAILGDMIGSEKVTNKLLLAYLPFVGLAILAMLRGLVTCSTKRSTVLARRKLA
ncbi:YUP8H12.17 [Arabidopsis thaliana]|jgi:hypothetical protein|uniref:Transmembrane protein 97, Putative n=3 Tax=Arabidopsis TaxID=3701 RepID=O23046_ARATH|nr:Transmembrane protein 97, Putative [Arabidopsis thaliana]KAG7595906.1 EXPERA domain [Arabidopsis suecica]AAB71457.1 YUP8H12.17 [Arabidopsis thaliana]AAU44371.1 hypothetical protein AT1G05220 [Arabidopsis thaliana]AAU44372.1 hypothetical protein AT1G05220 [Arabidopsis thaliana]AAX23726.1 hypothetical protein At1g05220 [Arabidopsis thaliana]|eukprot:NP_172014.1 Transmembrane protein 97, Putative [Arabidopsis thaliana]